MKKIDVNFKKPSQQQLISLLELYQTGKYPDAEKLSLSITQEFPEHQFAWKVLAVVLKLTGRISESLVASQKSVQLGPQDSEAHNNLGVTLQELGRLDEAEASYTQAIALKPDYAEAMLNLSITQSYMNNLEAEIVSLQNVLRIDSDDYGLRAGVSLAICNFLEGDFAESKKHLLAATKIQEKKSSESKPERVYWRYLSNILKWHENKYLANKKEKNDKNLYVLGESHSLTSHHIRIQRSGFDFFCKAKLIKGCKQWHLGNPFRNEFKNQFEKVFFSLPKYSDVLLAVGEIDCRIDSGIIPHKNKFPEKEIKEIILTTVGNYLTYIVNNNSDCQHNIVIQGVPCPNIGIECHAQKEVTQLMEVIKIFNFELKIKSEEKGLGFLDIHNLTDRGDGFSNNVWQIDGNHISPEVMLEAWSRYTC